MQYIISIRVNFGFLKKMLGQELSELADLEERLTKNFEVKLKKSLKEYKNEESQQFNKATKDLLISIVNYDKMNEEKIMKMKNELINLEKKCFGLLQNLPQGLKSLDAKFKELDLTSIIFLY